MKRYTSIAAISLAILTSPSFAANYTIIGISPYMAASGGDERAKKLILQIAEGLDAGDSVDVFDAFNIKSIASFSIAPEKNYKHIQQKLRANKSAVKSLVQFGRSKATKDKLPSGTLRIPKFLHFLSENGLVTPETKIILIGSPIFNDPLAKGYSMNKARVPSDGHIRASQRSSPFGMQETSKAFGGARIAFSYQGAENWQKSTAHEYAVKRFWTLLFRHAGLKVATFGKETGFAFKMLNKSTIGKAGNYRLEQSNKLEMIEFINRRVSRGSIFTRPIVTSPVDMADVNFAQGMEIGLRWKCAPCDLDLYVQAHERAAPLYFSKPKSPEGKYYKDYQRAPVTNGYELVDLKGRIDISKISIAVNYYGGRARKTPVEFELFISVDGLTFSRKYSFTAASGNKGAGRRKLLSATPQSPHWVVVRPHDIINHN